LNADIARDLETAFLQEPAAVTHTAAAPSDPELGNNIFSCTAPSKPYSAAQHPPANSSTHKATALLANFRQHCKGLPAAAATWWQMQPKGLLLLVAISFVLYICLTGALALLRKCSAGWVAVQLVFAAASVVLTVAATILQWRISSDNSNIELALQPGDAVDKTKDPAAAAPAAAAGREGTTAAVDGPWLLSQSSSAAFSSPFVLSMILESPDASSAVPSSSCSSTAHKESATSRTRDLPGSKTAAAAAAAVLPAQSVDHPAPAPAAPVAAAGSG
jgi:hypothetical protein